LTWEYFYESFLRNITGGGGNLLTISTLALTAGGIGYGVWRYLHLRDFEEVWGYLLIIGCSVFPAVAVVAYTWLVNPLFVDRFLLFTQPFNIILSVLGLMSFWQVRTIVLRVLGGVAAILLCALLASATITYHREFMKEDNRGVAEYIAQQYEPQQDGILYFIWRIDRMVQHYEPSLVSYVPNNISRKITEGELSQEGLESALIGNYQRVWVVTNRINTQARKNSFAKVMETIESQYELKETRLFYSVQVDLYSLD
jgi:4-amino-4-deoxy-L-arabinose transferase-like glycosyltransferase